MIDKIYLMLNISLFPFKDLSFYGSSMINEVVNEIYNSKEGKSKKKDNLLEIIHKNILLRCNPSGIDEINLILEKYYPYLFHKDFKFNSHNGIVKVDEVEREIYKSYFRIIGDFSTALLSHRDGEMVFKYWKNENDDNFLGPYDEYDKVHIFNTISRLIPIDILIQSYFARNGLDDINQLDGVYQHINLADAPLHNLLTKGVAENHIHASAAFNFSILWERLTNRDIRDKFIKKYLKNFKVNQYANSSEVYKYILTAQVLRIILGQFLFENKEGNICTWLKRSFGNDRKAELQLIMKVLKGQDKIEFLEVHILEEIIEELKLQFNLDDGDRTHDIMFSIFNKDTGIRTYGENILLYHCFDYVKRNESSAPDYSNFCSIFFRYIRIKNEFYQQVTQINSIKGLSFFSNYFDRATGGFNKKEESYYVEMLRTLFQNKYIRKIELRISILDSEEKTRAVIKRILTSYKKVLDDDYLIKDGEYRPFPRIGIVYHLIKVKDHIDKCWCISGEVEASPPDKLYYSRIQGNYFEKIKIILDIRREIPYISNFIVGLDAASLENNTPIQVFAPVFEKARNSTVDKLSMKGKSDLSISNQSLFFTFHAGEDFRHVFSGLRRIDEVISHCKFHSGDRIGHGIALGLNVDEWLKRNPIVIIPRGEYLDNLLWIWGTFGESSHIGTKSYIYLEKKIHEVSKEIFQNTNGLTPAVIYESYINRFNEFEIGDDFRLIECDDTKEPSGFIPGFQVLCPKASPNYNHYWDSRKLQHAYHCKCYLDKIQEPIYVQTSGMEAEMLYEMQKYMVGKVARKGIVVEVNPTSNFLIGEVSSVYDNQFFKINSSMDSDINSIAININTDDPIVFNTTVSNEIAYLYYGMLKRGYGREASLKWIEKIRESGIDTSFIRQNTKDINASEYIYMLDNIINEL